MTVLINDAKSIIHDIIVELLGEDEMITDEMQLIGGNASLDSMQLVELCLKLEDLADERGFEFDWTSEAALSKSRSMFRTLQSLAEEFSKQSN